MILGIGLLLVVAASSIYYRIIAKHYIILLIKYEKIIVQCSKVFVLSVVIVYLTNNSIDCYDSDL